MKETFPLVQISTWGNLSTALLPFTHVDAIKKKLKNGAMQQQTL